MQTSDKLVVYNGVGAQLDPLEIDGKLTSHDYTFLKGDSAEWVTYGAAFCVVSDWCRAHGYGDFGEPTERGIEAMWAYEQAQLMHHE